MELIFNLELMKSCWSIIRLIFYDNFKKLNIFKKFKRKILKKVSKNEMKLFISKNNLFINNKLDLFIILCLIGLFKFKYLNIYFIFYCKLKIE